MNYVDLVTSQHSQRPKFTALLAAVTAPLQQVQDALLGVPSKFDLDTATGDQLDTLGRWVGMGRSLVIPLAQDFFSWNTVGLGWNQANWKGPYVSSVGITVLGDDLYRLAIRAKILKNYTDGTAEQLVQILAPALQSLGVTLVPVDKFDMSLDLHVIGAPDAQVLELINRGYIVPKPMGVRINVVMGGGSGTHLFALDDAASGLDVGTFA